VREAKTTPKQRNEVGGYVYEFRKFRIIQTQHSIDYILAQSLNLLEEIQT